MNIQKLVFNHTLFETVILWPVGFYFGRCFGFGDLSQAETRAAALSYLTSPERLGQYAGFAALVAFIGWEKGRGEKLPLTLFFPLVGYALGVGLGMGFSWPVAAAIGTGFGVLVLGVLGLLHWLRRQL